MKKLALFLISINTLAVLSSFKKYPQNPLQVVLKSKQFKKVLKKQSEGKLYSPVILMIGEFDELQDSSFRAFNKEVILVEDEDDSLLKEKINHLPVSIIKASISNKKGIAKYILSFNKVQMLVKLEKEEEKWVLKKFSTQKAGVTLEMEWNF